MSLMGQIPSLPAARYRSNVEVKNFYDQLLERVRVLPGVQAAELCQVVPFSGGGGGAPFTVEGREPKPGAPARDSWWRAVTPGYFAAVGIPLLRGRPFDSADREGGMPVAIVDQTLARMYWPDDDATGKRIRIGQGAWMTIVGVVSSVKNRELNEVAKPYVYQPYAQRIRREMSLVVRTAAEPVVLASLVRQQIASLDPEQPIFRFMTLDDALARSVAPARTTNLLIGWFAMAAFLLAIVGVYGVMSLNVNGRFNEFGIRLALGARPITVQWLVVGRTLKLTLIAVAIGLLGAMGATRLLEGLLFGVEPVDVTIFTVVASVLATFSLVASYLPARRATKVDPLVALRCQYRRAFPLGLIQSRDAHHHRARGELPARATRFDPMVALRQQ